MNTMSSVTNWAFPMDNLKQRILAAGQAAFLPEAERDTIWSTDLKKELKLS